MPSWTALSRLVNRNSRATPRMISGRTNDSSTWVEAGGQPAPPAVQADGEGDPEGHGDQGGEHGQAQAVEQGPLQVGSFQTDSTGSCQYQRSEKPCQLERERPALNENHTAIATGRIDQAR